MMMQEGDTGLLLFIISVVLLQKASKLGIMRAGRKLKFLRDSIFYFFLGELNFHFTHPLFASINHKYLSGITKKVCKITAEKNFRIIIFHLAVPSFLFHVIEKNEYLLACLRENKFVLKLL
jgi:hypothetical protein